MSVEDAIGMYESDDDDWDPTEVPVIDRQKRTDSGTPVEGSKPTSMAEDRMSRSGLADFLIKQREEVASPTSRESGVSLVLETGVNLEEELHDAQNNEWEAITDKRKSNQVETSSNPKSPETSGNQNINRPAPDDTPPRYPPMKPVGTTPRDRYGFRTETQYITEKEYNEWYSKYDEILVRRKKKWDALLKEAGLTPLDNELPVRFPPRSQKVKRFVRKGIPPEWRGNAWFFYANGQKYIKANPGLYEKLVAQGAPTDSEAPELIERDLHRTHPDNIRFKPEQKYPLANGAKLTKHKQSNSKIVETPIIQSLRRVLTAFALYVPRIGYCQSLNFWAGMLLLFMDEERAFWMLYIITHQYLPGTHERSLEGSNIDQAVLMMAVKNSMPAVWSKISLCLDGTSVSFNNSKLPDITLCTASWLMSGFISNLPIETVLRVWDAFFYEGSKILFRISLALFKMAEPEIKQVNDAVEVFQIVQTTPRKCIDPGKLMDLCFKRRNGYGHLTQKDIDDGRKERKELLERERRQMRGEDGQPRSSKDDLSIRKGFARELIEEGEDSMRRFRNFIRR
ncbi:Carabin [Dactylella cylindrospora]|nr:Carabin [Dactylella cylindrospora]